MTREELRPRPSPCWTGPTSPIPTSPWRRPGVQRRYGVHRLQHRERLLRSHHLRRADRGGQSRQRGAPGLCPHRDRRAERELCVPCGVCRQVLREFAPNIEIICLNGAGEERTFTLEELLPHSFGPEYLQ